MKQLFVLLLLGVWGGAAFGCDLCSGYLGINPNYNQHTVNFRYRMSSFAGNHSHLTYPSEAVNHHHTRQDAGKYMHEYFETYELWGRFYPVPKLQVVASLPYARNLETYAGDTVAYIHGVRDAFALAQYQLVNSTPADSNGFQHRLLLGGGLKVPTGAYDVRSDDETWNPLLQPGTGSYDVLLAATWLAKMGRFGVSTDVLATIATRNPVDYRFANRINVTAHLFYQQKVGAFTVMPYAGSYMEGSNTDTWQNTQQLNTGGTVVFTSMGLDVFFKRFSATATLQLPTYERLNGSQGVNEPRVMLGFGYAINQ